jgi:hypothetical protein
VNLRWLWGGRRRDADRGAGVSEITVGRGVVRPVGRGVLWVALLVGLAVLVPRGLADTAHRDPLGASARSAVGSVWPDEEARAFAVAAARAYLTWSPRHPDFQLRALAPYLGEELREEQLVRVPRRGVDQSVAGATVARLRRLSGREALITVACTVLARTVSTRYVTVPVGRDARGGLAVIAPPFFWRSCCFRG